MSDVECEKFSRSISLYLDGRLDEAGERALREHLSKCPGCARTLAVLESAQNKARTGELVEPQPGYWDTFSSRVMEKIDAKKESPVGFGFRRLAAMIVPTPARRLRVAAGLVSIAAVIAVSVLYVEHRGGRVLPSGVSVPVEGAKGPGEAKDARTTHEVARMSNEQATPKEAGDALGKVEAGGAPPKSQTGLPEVAAKKELRPPSEANAPATAATEAMDVEKTAAAPHAPEKVAEGVEAKKTPEAARGEDQTTERTEKKGAEKTAATPLAAQAPPQTEAVAEKTIETTGVESFAAARKDTDLVSPAKSFVVGGTALQEITDKDTVIAEDELRTLIATWKTHIEKNLTDSLASVGYRQVASAYCLLARQTRDETVVLEGARVIKTYLERTEDPTVREFLTVKLAEIEALKKK